MKGVLIIERGRSVKGLKPFYVERLSVETGWLREEYLVITIDERKIKRLFLGDAELYINQTNIVDMRYISYFTQRGLIKEYDDTG